jgi:hypothetical protein
MRRPVDGDARIQKALADRVNIVDSVGQVTEVAPLVVFLGIPVVCQLDLRIFIPGCSQEYERESALFAFVALDLFKTQLVAVEIQ